MKPKVVGKYIIKGKYIHTEVITNFKTAVKIANYYTRLGFLDVEIEFDNGGGPSLNKTVLIKKEGLAVKKKINIMSSRDCDNGESQAVKKKVNGKPQKKSSVLHENNSGKIDKC